jgi:hypothetical protein
MVQPDRYLIMLEKIKDLPNSFIQMLPIQHQENFLEDIETLLEQ